MFCMLTTVTMTTDPAITVAMTTDPAIMVIGNHLIMIAGKPTMSMIGKSHHRNILRITAIISMNLQTTIVTLMMQTILKMAMCALRMKMNTPIPDIMMIIKTGTINMNDMSVPLQFRS